MTTTTLLIGGAVLIVFLVIAFILTKQTEKIVKDMPSTPDPLAKKSIDWDAERAKADLEKLKLQAPEVSKTAWPVSPVMEKAKEKEKEKLRISEPEGAKVIALPPSNDLDITDPAHPLNLILINSVDDTPPGNPEPVEATPSPSVHDMLLDDLPEAEPEPIKHEDTPTHSSRPEPEPVLEHSRHDSSSHHSSSHDHSSSYDHSSSHDSGGSSDSGSSSSDSGGGDSGGGGD